MGMRVAVHLKRTGLLHCPNLGPAQHRQIGCTTGNRRLTLQVTKHRWNLCPGLAGVRSGNILTNQTCNQKKNSLHGVLLQDGVGIDPVVKIAIVKSN